nr:hypothetical protein [uncultured bacterium]
MFSVSPVRKHQILIKINISPRISKIGQPWDRETLG